MTADRRTRSSASEAATTAEPAGPPGTTPDGAMLPVNPAADLPPAAQADVPRLIWVIGRVAGSLRIRQLDLAEVDHIRLNEKSKVINAVYKEPDRRPEILVSAESVEEADAVMKRLFAALVEGRNMVMLG